MRARQLSAVFAERLKVAHQVTAYRQGSGIEPLYLRDAGAGILRQGVDVDLTLGLHQPHTDSGVAE